SRASPAGIRAPVPSYTHWIRSWPWTTWRLSLRMIHSDTNAPAPAAPRELLWVCATPSAGPNELARACSWFIRTVNVPSPLSNAPSPSGVPAVRYPFAAASPAEMMAVVVTDGLVGTTYGVAAGTSRVSSGSSTRMTRLGRRPGFQVQRANIRRMALPPEVV